MRHVGCGYTGTTGSLATEANWGADHWHYPQGTVSYLRQRVNHIIKADSTVSNTV